MSTGWWRRSCGWVRTFPRQRLRKVAANVLSNTRAHLLATDLPMSVGRSTGRRQCRLVDPHSALWEQVAALPERARPDDAGGELREVLVDATDAGVLAAADRGLLQVLLDQAHYFFRCWLTGTSAR